MSNNKKRNVYVNRCCKFRDRHVTKKEAEKFPKYKDLTIEIQRMWNVKTKVITGKLEPSKNQTEKYLRNIPGKHDQETKENSHNGDHTHFQTH